MTYPSTYRITQLLTTSRELNSSEGAVIRGQVPILEPFISPRPSLFFCYAVWSLQ